MNRTQYTKEPNGDNLFAQLRTLPDGCLLFLEGRTISPETISRNPNVPQIVRVELDKVIGRAYQRGRRCFIASSRTIFESYTAEQLLKCQEQALERSKRVFLVSADSYFSKISTYFLLEKVCPQAWIVKRKDAFDCPFINLNNDFIKYRMKENWAPPCF